MKHVFLSVLALCVLCAGVWFLLMKENSEPLPKTFSGTEMRISMTNDGFVPSEITLKRGDTIVWFNESSDWRWPASNLHPTHLLYSEFDPLKPVAPGESWSFRFDKTGDWRFHDHLRPNKGGVVHITL